MHEYLKSIIVSYKKNSTSVQCLKELTVVTVLNAENPLKNVLYIVGGTLFIITKMPFSFILIVFRFVKRANYLVQTQYLPF